MAESKAIQIPLLGINRADSYFNSTPGNMEEVINLRKFNGSFQPFGDHHVLIENLNEIGLVDTDGNPILDTDGNQITGKADQMWIHKTNTYTHYIIRIKNNLYWALTPNNNPPTLTINPLIQDINDTVRFFFNGNIVTVNWLTPGADVENEIQEPNKEYFIWKEDTYIEIDLSILNNIDFKLDTVYEKTGAREYVMALSEADENNSEEATRGFYQTVQGYFAKSNQELLKLGKPVGFFTYAVCIKLYDGSHIQLTPIKLSSPSILLESTINPFINGEDVSTNVNGLIKYTYFKVMDIEIMNNNNLQHEEWRIKNLEFKRNLVFGFNNSDLEKIKDYIISVDVFFSPQIYYEQLNDDLFNYIYSREDTGIPNTGFKILKRIREALFYKENVNSFDIIKDKIVNSPLYKVKSIEIEDFLKDEDTYSYTLKGEDFLNLEVKDSFSNMRLVLNDIINYSDFNYLYNNKNHYGNNTTLITKGFNLKKYQQEKYDFTDNTDGIVTIPACIISQSIIEDTFVKTYLKTEDGISIVVNSLSKIHSDIRTDFATPNGAINNLTGIITYPDSRAYKMEFFIKSYSLFYKIKTIELRTHPIFPNTAYYFAENLSNTEYNIPILAELPEEKNAIKNNPNELSVSEINNPFIVTDSNKYIVGTGKILGLCSNTQAITIGQFGQYPLLAFCSDGIYSLGVGIDGNVDYTNIKPFSRDVCNNPDSITPIDSSIIFVSNKGLMITDGNIVEEISQLVEGNVFHFLDIPTLAEGNVQYIDLLKKALNHELLVKLDNSVSRVNFLDYIKGAKIGFIYGEHREIIISNPDYEYSYMYSFKNGIWTKTSESYDILLSDYPALNAKTSAGNLIELTNEIPAESKPSFFLTSPYNANTNDFKTITRAALRGNIIVEPGKYAGFYVFVSEDGIVWRFAGGTELNGKVNGRNSNAPILEIGTTTERTSFKFFRFAFAGCLQSKSTLDYVELSIRERFTGKLV